MGLLSFATNPARVVYLHLTHWWLAPANTQGARKSERASSDNDPLRCHEIRTRLPLLTSRSWAASLYDLPRAQVVAELVIMSLVRFDVILLPIVPIGSPMTMVRIFFFTLSFAYHFLHVISIWQLLAYEFIWLYEKIEEIKPSNSKLINSLFTTLLWNSSAVI